MAQLPLLVEHGPVVWKLAAGAAAVAGVLVARWLRARRERRAAAREVAEREARITEPTMGSATIRGMLVGGSAASLSRGGPAGAQVRWERAPTLWLDCDGERIELAGPIRVLRGSRAAVGRRAPAATPSGLPPSSGTAGPFVLARVDAGDLVIATGELSARPGNGATGYRESTTAWSLAGDGDQGEIELIAAAPATRALPLGIARTLGIGLAAAGLTVGVLSGVGRLALWSGSRDRTGLRVPAQLRPLEALSLAAATPGNRGAALDQLAARFAERYQRTAAALAQWQEVERIRGGCGAELRMRTDEDQIEGLAALARSCEDGPAAAAALHALGFHDEALARRPPASPPWQRQDLEALIAVGRWQDAAEQIARWPAPPPRREGKPRPAVVFTCLERWVRRRATQAPTVAPNEDARRDPLCAVVEALSLPRGQQAAALSAIAAATLDQEDRDAGTGPEATRAAIAGPHATPLIRALAWAAGASLDPRDGDDSARAAFASIPMSAQIVFELGAADTNLAIAVALLAPAARTVRGDAPGTRGFVLTHFWSAVNAMLRGDRAAALAETRDAQRGDAAQDHRARGWQDEARSLETSLRLRNSEPFPDGDSPLNVEPEAVALRQGGLVLAATRFPLRTEDDLRQYRLHADMRAAADGDATRLDDLIAPRGLAVTTGVEQLFALWPRVVRDRERFADHIRMIARSDGIPRGPLESIAYAAMRRDLALLIRDGDIAAGWQGIVDRNVAALADRDRLLGVVLLELVRRDL